MKTTVDKILKIAGIKKDTDKGLGDTIENITKATGFKALVDKMSAAKLCGGCQKRKEAFNKRFPYGIKGVQHAKDQ